MSFSLTHGKEAIIIYRRQGQKHVSSRTKTELQEEMIWIREASVFFIPRLVKCTTDLPATARTVAASENPHRGEWRWSWEAPRGRVRSTNGWTCFRLAITRRRTFVLTIVLTIRILKKKKRPEKMSQNFNRLGDKGKKGQWTLRWWCMFEYGS